MMFTPHRFIHTSKVEISTTKIIPPRKFVKLVQVGPRDGLQNIKTKILTPQVKARYINLLLRAGFKDIEVGSFVSDSVAQMKSTPEVLNFIERVPRTNLIVLVGNKRYAEIAADYQILNTFAVFTAVSESFCEKNNGCTIDKNLEKIRGIAHVASSRGLFLRGYVSCVFGCPFEGYNQDKFVEKTILVVKQLLDLGCYEVSIADTIGTADAMSVIFTLSALRRSGIDMKKIAIHLHDPLGNAYDSLTAALYGGVSIIDCASGGMEGKIFGGCPSVKTPSSNIDTTTVLETLQKHNFDHCVTNVLANSYAARYIQDEI